MRRNCASRRHKAVTGCKDLRSFANRQQAPHIFGAPISSAGSIRMTAKSKRLHPLPVRIMHWINALAMLIMISSGWNIYNN
jgi:hypothetical protein